MIRGCADDGARQLVLDRSRDAQRRLHELIPGGCHTYAKGDDQFPLLAPGVIQRGNGCRVWDLDGNEYIEYGMGGRSVTLGHAFPPVLEAAWQAMSQGTNFSRPSHLELECAEQLLGLIDGADMVKFTKDGSTATTAAVKLARACTGRELVALCRDHPFFSYDDWFLATTPVDAGIPAAVRPLSLAFSYNDPASLEALFARYPHQIAAVMLEPAKYEHPRDGFLQRVQQLCRSEGALLVLDEMITGFRWHLGGAQKYYGVTPDLSTFGKALGNGFAISALLGKRQYMERGGLRHQDSRVFLLSTTHGAETHALAAARAVMSFYEQHPVIEHLNQVGEQLQVDGNQALMDQGVDQHVRIVGLPCNLVFTTLDAAGQPSQAYRSLFLQELIRRGVLATSLVVSYSHQPADIARTVEAIRGAAGVYRRALEDGVERFLVGSPSRTVYRRYN
ncbi:MAG: glutamate-1-semialdehyde 2,1-aminomutase [Pirellulaceae bacterium]|nr:glutamate-1-semialdehyde 2,1-aminomutase [Pirellulaceae bacterium]